jgi:hypothetical protein
MTIGVGYNLMSNLCLRIPIVSSNIKYQMSTMPVGHVYGLGWYHDFESVQKDSYRKAINYKLEIK